MWRGGQLAHPPKDIPVSLPFFYRLPVTAHIFHSSESTVPHSSWDSVLTSMSLPISSSRSQLSPITSGPLNSPSSAFFLSYFLLFPALFLSQNADPKLSFLNFQ